MSIKMKLVSCISAFILVLGIFIFGVLSAEQATVNLGGSISFDATDVYARVTGKVQNAQTNPTLDTLEFSATNDTPDQSSWSGLELQFDSRATDITIEVTVENLSMERELTVNVTDALATPVDNLGKTILLDGASYVSGMNKTIPVATAADASNTSKVTFTITLDVLDHNKSLPSTTFDYDINLYDENSVPVVTYQPFEFEVIDGTENEVRITNHSGSGDVVIPESFSVDSIPVTSFTTQNFSDLGIRSVALYLGEFYCIDESGQRTQMDIFELETDIGSLTFPMTIEPTYRYEFDGYSDINAMLLLYAIIGPSEAGYTDNINYRLTNDEFATGRDFTTQEMISYIYENYPNAESDPTTLEPLFSTTGPTILETDPIKSSIIVEGVDYLITEIGYESFTNCDDLTSITIPSSITNIGARAFDGCMKLTSITIGESVTSIGSSAFSGCYALAEIYNYSSNIIVKLGETSSANNGFLGQYAKVVYNASDLVSGKPVTRITVVNDVQYYSYGDDFIALAPMFRLVKEISLDSRTSEINPYAFYYCDILTSLTIPANVTNIGDYAFEYCRSLTSITIPEGVKNIGIAAFGRCSSLTTVDFEENNQLISIGDSAFLDCSSLESIEIPEGVTEIASGAFSGCSGLTSVTFGEASQLTNIGSIAFVGCSSLTSITIPENVTSIGDSAFSDCSSLTSITIPDSVTSIGERAFSYCSNLTSITIPSSVTSIGVDVFYRCNFSGVTIDSSYAYQNAGAGNYDCGALLANADTVYVNANLVEDTSLTASSYLTSNFTRSETAENGYYVYTRN